MPKSMLNYGKTILEKVSFDKHLFWKEYDKFCQELEKEECGELNEWLSDRFRDSLTEDVDLIDK